jgi:formate--tetrahydrofolate ligase
MKNILDISNNLNIPEEDVECYGKYKAKISEEYFKKVSDKKDGKLILMTSINPTPFGEGKTTQSIGLSMGLNKIGKKSIVVLREPSLGPVFGIKGGAIGGGKATVEPQEDINLHFTGDFHAITSANNLLCAVVDNHIFNGNELNIDMNKIVIKRAIDMNERSLRDITINGKKVSYETGFEITAACEVMAICCLANNKEDLREMLGNIIVAYNIEGKPVYARELQVVGAMMALLKDVLKPNLVQTVDETPCIVHLGPFANIAHGCNSVVATRLGLKLADYCIVEAGFGSDLGAEKFMDIKCQKAGLKPDLSIIVATVKALKYNGYMPIDEISKKNMDYLKSGIENLGKHIENMKKYNVPVMVCINKYDTDEEEEIEYIRQFALKYGVDVEISDAFSKGADGTVEFANKVVELLQNSESKYTPLYNLDLTIEEKIEKICKEIYGADNVVFLDDAIENINKAKQFGYNNLPVCIAKTPSSLTDDAKILGRPTGFSITIRNIKINSGAGFIVAYAGNIMTLPGLGKTSKYRDYENK